MCLPREKHPTPRQARGHVVGENDANDFLSDSRIKFSKCRLKRSIQLYETARLAPSPQWSPALPCQTKSSGSSCQHPHMHKYKHTHTKQQNVAQQDVTKRRPSDQRLHLVTFIK